MLDILVPKIISETDTFEVHPYKGIGSIPKNMKDSKSSSNRILLENLPKLLKGYGKTFAQYGSSYKAAVIVVCDLDSKNYDDFHSQLVDILNSCTVKPETKFCIAIEEGEAWILGDIEAIKKAYPRAKDGILQSYINDSICGTWEKLADAVYTGGSLALSKMGFQKIGTEKSLWAEAICPFMDVKNNRSPSFNSFVNELTSFV